KALLLALLEPREQLRQFESAGDYSGRLALLEETKTLPFGAVWDHYCLKMNVPAGMAWFKELKQYEQEVTSQRG
ncbi:L-rhamnose isomerase, partial [candidate division KSB1 bacterium]|nr:L-rhamnose isomerase [candidate division KSB1 bacterium]